MIVCTTVVFLTVGYVLLYIGSVHQELSQLRQDLVQMETCVRRISQKTGGYGNGIVGTQEVGESSNDELVLVSWYEEVEASVVRVPVSDPPADDDDADEDGEEAVGVLSRRSKREAAKVESRSGDTKVKKKTKAPKAGARKEKKDPKQDSTSRTQAIHFVPVNSSERTITTKPNSPVLDFWQPAKWSNKVNNSFYHLRDGAVTIKEEGLYFIYVQIVFHDLSGRWSFSININDRQELKCINSEHISSASSLHPTNHGVYQHCFSSSLFYIHHLEQVTIRSLYEQRNILLSPEFTFWGLIKMPL